MADLRKWVGGDASCHHTSRNVLAGGLQSCAECGATGIADAPALYTQADLDAAVTAALREAADAAKARDAKWMRKEYEITYAKLRYDVLGVQRCENKFGNILSEDIEAAILALIPDAGAALDRALAAERERCAKVADWQAANAEAWAKGHGDTPPAYQKKCQEDAEIMRGIAAAIRAQDKP